MYGSAHPQALVLLRKDGVGSLSNPCRFSAISMLLGGRLSALLKTLIKCQRSVYFYMCPGDMNYQTSKYYQPGGITVLCHFHKQKYLTNACH